MTDHEIRVLAKTARWPTAVASGSGFARRVALVVDDAIEMESGEHLEFDSTFFHVIDALSDLKTWAAQSVEHYNLLLPKYTLPRKLIRAVDLGPADVHVFSRVHSTLEDMCFCCSTCGLQVMGCYVPSYSAPIEFLMPDSKIDQARLKNPCQARSFSALAL